MKPINFKESNIILKGGSNDIADLPALVTSDSDKIVVTCWKLTLQDRLKLLFTGRLWNCTMSFGKPLMPVKLTANRKDAYLISTDKEYKD